MTLLLLSIFFALFFSFICSLSESVLLSMNSSHIQKLIDEGHPIGKVLKLLKSDIDRSLSSVLIINTLANTLGAVGVGAQAVRLFGDASLAIVSALMTLAVLIFSEIIPKSIGAYYWKPLSLPVGHILKWFVTINTPLLKVTELITSGIKPSNAAPRVTRDDLRIMADIARQEDQFSEKEVEVLNNLMFMGEMKAKGVMTPRTVMLALPETMTVGGFTKDYSDTPFSRIPLYADNEDDIDGFVLKTDILLATIRGETDKPLKDFLRPIQIVLETMSLSDLFYSLIDKKRQIVLVVDEYGAVSGLVSLEDIVEHMIGREIMDELDNVSDLQVLAKKRWRRKQVQHQARQEIMEPEQEG